MTPPRHYCPRCGCTFELMGECLSCGYARAENDAEFYDRILAAISERLSKAPTEQSEAARLALVAEVHRAILREYPDASPSFLRFAVGGLTLDIPGRGHLRLGEPWK